MSESKVNTVNSEWNDERITGLEERIRGVISMATDMDIILQPLVESVGNSMAVQLLLARNTQAMQAFLQLGAMVRDVCTILLFGDNQRHSGSQEKVAEFERLLSECEIAMQNLRRDIVRCTVEHGIGATKH